MSNLLEVKNLSKQYKVKTGWFKRDKKTVLEPLSFSLDSNETLAIAGEIGSGKSTLAKLLVGAARPTTGDIFLNGQLLETGNFKQRCQHVRMIFQNAGSTLNPSLTIRQQLEEPLKLNTKWDEAERLEVISSTLEKVGLLADHMHFYPHMFSGGQKQRISLARAIILQPQVVILDEALTALDLSLRAQLINLLLELQQAMGLTYILISHDLDVIQHFSDKIMILRKGKVVEYGTTAEVLANPKNSFTRNLMQAQRKGPSKKSKKHSH
ncbi:ATP-binding cassette domain-containing protein [Thalassotalea ponticola]|uniref:peptide ABC transporter ATP-binding protein n=1 Tax=Thalassotalea ponticola TaxID=1523392 RepID=UPI0025B49649|nr:ATP-binding cassette domain-containing protein [Thalassotalea ponticola]MDN3653165.1 ATP-binding cassette domain-containing protein [Thalassotalea ponticola]